MNIKIATFLLLVSVTFVACGEKSTPPVMLNGTVDLSEVPQTHGPVFLCVLNTLDYDKIINDPFGTILEVININDDGTFSINLMEMGISAGDTLYFIAFADNDYNKGIPFPTLDDYVGFYIDSNWNPSFVVRETNDEIALKVNRRVYEYEAKISGRILDESEGTFFVIVYAGDIVSMSPSAFDVDAIIGYKKITKPAGSCPYEVQIMPYGYNIPIQNALVFIVHDVNNNGIPDPGDRIGFYIENGDVVPRMLNIRGGTIQNIDLMTMMDIPSPSGYNITIEGSFTKPAGYSAHSRPVFVIIADGNDISSIFANPFSAIKEFTRVENGDNTFSIDLSRTSLVPGDEVIVLALWDRDFEGGFPNPTTLDKVGIYQYIGVISNYQYSITLQEGTNTVQPSRKWLESWEFDINKIYYPFHTSIEFKIDPAGRPSGMDENHNLILMAVHDDGVVDLLYDIIDVNYILGMAIVPYRQDSEYVYSFDIFPALDERIADPTTMPIYVYYVLYDRDADGMPSSGDDIAAYWEELVFVKVPKKWNLISDSVNVLSSPNGDPNNPYAVRFLGSTY